MEKIYKMTSGKSYRIKDKWWNSSSSDIIQGQYRSDGIWCGCMLFDGDALRRDAAANNIAKIELYLRRQTSSHGSGGDTAVRVCNFEKNAVGTGNPLPYISNEGVAFGSLGRGESAWVDITEFAKEHFTKNKFDGLALYNLNAVSSDSWSYYVRCFGGTSADRPALRVTFGGAAGNVKVGEAGGFKKATVKCGSAGQFKKCTVKSGINGEFK